MSVSVSMPQLGESVTEGTVTRWLKKEGERVEADEPLLEVSTDKVDTEIPSPAAGVLREIAVGEDETVEVGAQLAVIEEGADASGDGAPAESPAPAESSDSAESSSDSAEASSDGGQQVQSEQAQAAAPQQAQTAPEPGGYGGDTQGSPATGTNGAAATASPAPAPAPAPSWSPPAQQAPAPPAPPAQAPAAPPQQASGQLSAGGDGPYVTPLVRKLAAEHGVDLESLSGTGVGGRIRKQDVLDASRSRREQEAAAQAQAAQAAQAQAAPAQAAPAQAAPSAPAQAPAPAAQAPAGGAPAAAPTRAPIVPSSLRGTTQRLSRPRAVIAKRMVESLQTSAQLTTVVEADVTGIARLRDRAKADFEAREGVKLSFLPFFALATIEALKVHPKLNAVIDTANNQVTYHDAEHLGIAVDAERGLMVPVVHNAGDLNLGGLARKIADLANRTRSGQVGPDELSGSTFTLTNTGSRGALFDTPIINQPEVGILGTGTVVKRPVVVDDPALGEVIAVRSVVYLALTYDHRLVDGADAARFLVTVKERLEEGSFEAELGL
jgi:2-oxoglutarate dehydrogenase E2 component (dihydrolipoamide succinyltransferase)